MLKNNHSSKSLHVTVVILHMWSDFFPPKKEMIKIKTHDIKPHVLCLNNLQFLSP